MSRVQQHRFVDLAGLREKSRKGSALDRRRFLAAAATATAGSAIAADAIARDFNDGFNPTRYPEPDVLVLDKAFRYKLGNTPIMRLYHGTLWAEGPAWNAVGRYLLWSDIPNNEQLRWTEEDGYVSRYFRYPSGHSNGNTFDYQGRQISCCHFPRELRRYEWDGSVTVLADKNDEGKGFNAPNDAVVHPEDGSIWFTDPGYGALMNYEGERVPESANSPQPFIKEAVYRLDAQSGKITKITDAPFKPNGLCFSHDYKKLYVADTGASHYADAKNRIWQLDVNGDKADNPREFASMELDGKSGFADGIRCDEDGNVWSSAGWVGEGYDGVHVFSPEGQRIGQIRLPEICSNVCFGGSKRNRLFMTGSQSLYAVFVETRGAHIT
ncbi:MAG: SMP-30/gluconolactonase/LRE family protein [Geminicoccaceae bacterium]